jgi:hypothetical protein
MLQLMMLAKPWELQEFVMEHVSITHIKILKRSLSRSHNVHGFTKQQLYQLLVILQLLLIANHLLLHLAIHLTIQVVLILFHLQTLAPPCLRHLAIQTKNAYGQTHYNQQNHSFQKSSVIQYGIGNNTQIFQMTFQVSQQ